ncbi:hypothetical protein [Microbacterium sp. K24]|uniref:hypothetical protein n=1 Tax=Microbacterium sp. K24 TaxID=2305446 RepID=UPI00109D1913|nr:hypothetical protein [Microbacterium sp. K24]
MRVRPPNYVAWLIDYLRAEVREEYADAEVGNKEPDTLALPLKKPLIIVRDDSGPRRDWTTFGRSIGVTVLWSTKQNDRPAMDLALLVASIVFDTDLPLVEGSPIASVEIDGCNGPYAVPDRLDVARMYLTAQYVVAGSA